MYIFEHQSALGAARPKGRILDILLQCREIRDKLGTKEYLLDCYVQNFFGAWKGTILSEVAEQGTNRVWSLSSLCRAILQGEVSEHERKARIYEIAASFIANHPLPFQEMETRGCIYACALFDKFVLSESSFIERMLLDDIDFDTGYTEDAFKRICGLLGDSDEMDALNEYIRKMLVNPTVMEVYLRGMREDLLLKLSYRDCETSRQVFQILLDNPQLLADASKL